MSELRLPMNILLCVDEPGHFGAIVRGLWPLQALQEAEVCRVTHHKWPGPTADDMDPAALEAMLKQSETESPEFPPALIRDIAGADVIVLPQTACSAWYGQIKYWQHLGKVVVADADDDSFNVHPTSPSYGVRGEEECDLLRSDGTVGVRWMDRERFPPDADVAALATGDPRILMMNLAYNRRAMGRYRQSLKDVDAITTTTERAATRFREFNPNVFVLPNSIDTNFYVPGRHPSRPPFRILWYGGNSHEADVLEAAKGLGAFLRRHGDVTMVVAGSILEVLVRHVPPEQLEAWEWTSAAAHPWRLMCLCADLAFCAVQEGSKFNACKSPLKWTEMGALGVPSICTDAPPYSDVVRHGDDGWLVKNTATEWDAAFEKMYADADLRKRIGVGARKRVEADFDLYRNAGLWFEAYRSLVSARRSIIVPEGVK